MRIGNYSNLSFKIRFLNEFYTEKHMNEYSIAFLMDVLFNPNVEDGKFQAEDVKKCKNKLAKSIQKLPDNKLKYTGNYVADRAPEILVKSVQTGTGATITFELVKNMHTVFNIGNKPRALELTIPSASETYSCEFTTGAASLTFRYPSTLKWVNGIRPTLEVATTYHLSIVNNCAAIVAFKVSETPA
jgi:hypothetical protein